ncbi:hypothetical protein [Streptomyces tsukubensis]|uniref:Uncharacterized protein n=1 Tax=Streptomyces tsukubensis TaxID=83656 RepID=A0A1V4AD84_9ACTN|nr:hypothetical protein [Streptomyces tsukubensis]OON81367.1 hypothetical protein B1H18_08530 [Streptomyces tsukubensis]QFR95507.1 hypothetical protein GBW32_23900 [Streptomyces tsukubensis]
MEESEENDVNTDWVPPQGETLALRVSVVFATGCGTKTFGLRSFRDTERNDIQNELAGWPERPPFALRGKTSQAAGIGLGTAISYIPRLINLAFNLAGPSGEMVREFKGLGEPTEPENETEDFPVIWAAPDTLARTLPWQLDPARRPKDYGTSLALTDRRLIVFGADETREGEPGRATYELWSTPREHIAKAERMPYSGGADIRIHFIDGSWTRFEAREAGRLVEHFRGERRPVTEDALTDAQRERIAELVADPPLKVDRLLGKKLPVEDPPMFDQLPDGSVAAYIAIPLTSGRYAHYAAHYTPSGERFFPEESE